MIKWRVNGLTLYRPEHYDKGVNSLFLYFFVFSLKNVDWWFNWTWFSANQKAFSARHTHVTFDVLMHWILASLSASSSCLVLCLLILELSWSEGPPCRTPPPGSGVNVGVLELLSFHFSLSSSGLGTAAVKPLFLFFFFGFYLLCITASPQGFHSRCVNVCVQLSAGYSSHMLCYSKEKSIKWRNRLSPRIRYKSAAAWKKKSIFFFR